MIVVVGGGTAGCISSLLFKHKYPDADITMIASRSIGTLGPGEGLTPIIHRVLKDLGISIETFLKETNGTIKNGVNFINWGTKQKSWFHGFYDLVQDRSNIFKDRENFFNNYKTAIALDKNIDDINFGSAISYDDRVSLTEHQDYACHIDAKKMTEFFEKVALEKGIDIVDAIVDELVPDQNNNISYIKLDNGTALKTDFVVDCTGFKRLIIGKHYGTRWIGVKEYLPATNAIACKIPITEDPHPYTEAIAMDYGWAWKIPLQNRYGCGYVYDSSFINKDEAEKELRARLGDSLEVVGAFSFEPGYYEKIWINNCLGVGISTVFFEPLEATSIANMCNMVYAFLDNFSDKYFAEPDKDDIDYFNQIFRHGSESLTAFLYLHYLTNKTNTDFWKNFKRDHPMPEFGKYNVRLFLDSMNKDLYYEDILTPPSWRLYSWLLIYAGNELHKSEIELDKDSVEEYNRIVQQVLDKAKQETKYNKYINNIRGE